MARQKKSQHAGEEKFTTGDASKEFRSRAKQARKRAVKSVVKTGEAKRAGKKKAAARAKKETKEHLEEERMNKTLAAVTGGHAAHSRKHAESGTTRAAKKFHKAAKKSLGRGTKKSSMVKEMKKGRK